MKHTCTRANSMLEYKRTVGLGRRAGAWRCGGCDANFLATERHRLLPRHRMWHCHCLECLLQSFRCLDSPGVTAHFCARRRIGGVACACTCGNLYRSRSWSPKRHPPRREFWLHFWYVHPLPQHYRPDRYFHQVQIFCERMLWATASTQSTKARTCGADE